MMQGKCPDCGKVYYGWALKMPRNQMCENCGADLEINDNGVRSLTSEGCRVQAPPPSLSPDVGRAQ